MVYYGNERQLEYDFVVAPGGRHTDITLAFDGAKSLRLDSEGNLLVGIGAGSLVQRSPVIYQEKDGKRRAVRGGYVIRKGGLVGFRVGKYDKRLPLVIDPILTYSTYLGGSNDERANAVAVDAQGHIVVVGETYSSDFPTANAIQGEKNFGGDVFIAKLTPAGDALVYATYLGGINWESGRGVALDAAGSAYVVGATFSQDFPTLNAAQSTFHGQSDSFVAKLNAAGGLVYSTYLGGLLEDYGNGIAIDGSGRAHIAGHTISADFPTVNALQPSLGGNAAYRTVDGGATWTPMNTGLLTIGVRAFAIDPTEPATVYAGGEEGMFKSTDSGQTWTYLNQEQPPPPFALATGAGSPAAIYSATFAGVYRSLDQGSTWTDLQLWMPIASLAIPADSPSTIYAAAAPNFQGGVFTGVFRSTDGGDTWTDTGMTEPVNALAASGSTVYATTSSGVFKNVNGGGWSAVNTGLPPEVSAMAVDPTDASVVYAGTSAGPFKTTSGGAEWFPIPDLVGLPVVALAVAPSAPSTVFLLTPWGELGVSNDGGQSWSSAGTSPAGSLAFAIDPQVPTTLYLGGSRSWDAFLATISADGSTLQYSTFLGGSMVEQAYDIALDAAGNRYLFGQTMSTDFPAVNAVQPTLGGLADAFVAKLSPTGSLAYATYLGGWGSEFFGSIAVDSSGRAHVTGLTWSQNFPVANASQPVHGGGFSDVFLSVLTPAGNAFEHSTFLGGSGAEIASTAGQGPSVTVTPSGEIYVTGSTASIDFPTTPDALQAVYAGGLSDAFVSRFNAAGQLQFSTYLGGSNADYAHDIAVDSTGGAIVTGYTGSTDWPIANAFQSGNAGTDDGFIARIGEDATAPVISVAAPEARDYLHTDTLTLAFSAVDSGSGLAAGSPAATLDGTPRAAGEIIRVLDLALGTHVLVVSATDGAGNTSQQTVEFRVIATVESLSRAVRVFADENQMDSFSRLVLLARLAVAKWAIEHGQSAAAQAQLQAFIDFCTTQSGRRIAAAAASTLIADAQYVLGTL